MTIQKYILSAFAILLSASSQFGTFVCEADTPAPERNTNYANEPPVFGEPISPLLQSKWGQGWPYNEMAPEIDGKHCPIGCGATAMAQVIKHYEYPSGFHNAPYNIHLPGVAPYIFPIEWSTVPVTDFDFNLMSDTYPAENDGSVPQENIDAVAKLMYYCAQSIHTAYKPEISSSSGIVIGKILEELYGYKHSSLYHFSTTSSDEEWGNMIYDCLSNGEPVLCSLSNNLPGQAGHIALIDGYMEGWQFHFNFGWDGAHNGYYDLRNIHSEFMDYIPDYALIGIAPNKQTSINNMIFTTPEPSICEVYSISGSLVYKGKESGIHLPSGVYIIKSADKIRKIAIQSF